MLVYVIYFSDWCRCECGLSPVSKNSLFSSISYSGIIDTAEGQCGWYLVSGDPIIKTNIGGWWFDRKTAIQEISELRLLG